jgi:hypothetical protein
MKHLKTFTESSGTDFSDHEVGPNVNISNNKTFGAPTPTKLPTDYFGIPDDIIILSSKKDEIGDRNSIEVNLKVFGPSKKISQEKIVLIENSKDSFRLYAYEYNEIFE